MKQTDNRQKILEYTSGVGGFTSGLEKSGRFLVEEVINLDPHAKTPYNTIHKKKFDSKLHISDISCSSVDLLVIRTPPKDFVLEEIFHAINRPKGVVVIGDSKHLMSMNSSLLTSLPNGLITANRYASFLYKVGYHVDMAIIDIADVSVPQHRSIGIITGSQIGFPVSIKVDFSPQFTAFEAFSGLSPDQENAYITPEYSNPYDQFCRSDNVYDTRPSQHEFNFSKAVLDKCMMATNNGIDGHRGYYRLPIDDIFGPLQSRFLLPSTRKGVVHPILDRPLTIREGCRLFGLTDAVTFDSDLSRGDISPIIYNSYSPLLGLACSDFINSYLW